jgi:polyhydroxyalkanoate synthesis regulator phasin
LNTFEELMLLMNGCGVFEDSLIATAEHNKQTLEERPEKEFLLMTGTQCDILCAEVDRLRRRVEELERTSLEK